MTDFPDTLVRRARLLEESVRDEATRMLPQLRGAVMDPYAEALRLAATRLVPSVWNWRVEPCYGGQAVFIITQYNGS